MRGKFITGAIVGAAVGMMLIPGMDRMSRRRIMGTARMVKNAAGDAIEGMRDKMM